MQASKELLGQNNVYPLIALGLYRVKSSWKLFSRMNDIDPEIANTVSKGIENYERAVKYADDDEKDDILIEDFIQEDYLDVFNESKDARSIIDNIKPHPCAVCVAPINIRKEFGVMAVGRGENKVLCIAAEGNIEKLGYVKNDLLVVSVVDILNKIYKKIDVPQHTPEELIKICDSNPHIYDIYSKGQVVEVNQMGAERTKKYLQEFIPKNIYDLSTTVASIRPGAMSVIDRIMSRKKYSYGSKAIDETLSLHTGSAPAIIYQETIMSLLSMSGIDVAESYKVLKAISKKIKEVILGVKPSFTEGISKLIQQEGLTEEESLDVSEELWVSIENSSAYAFNAPHSLSTALDSLYMAYLKTFYPEETYAVLLDYYLLGKKRKIEKVSAVKKELESIGYKIAPVQYGQDNRDFTLSDNTFTQSLMSMKSSNEHLAEILYECSRSQVQNYLTIYEKIKEKKNPETNRAYCTKRHWTILCKANYFPDANNKKLEIYIPIIYDKIYTKKQFRLDSLTKLKQTLNIDFDITPYCMKQTAKTYYLDPQKISDLCTTVFNLITSDEYVTEEIVRNQIEIFGFLSNPDQYIKDKIFSASVQAISRKNNSLLIKTMSGNETWVSVEGDISQIKRKSTIVIFRTKPVVKFGKANLLVTEYLTYI
jgi:DNA polymerase III alpha subunit